MESYKEQVYEEGIVQIDKLRRMAAKNEPIYPHIQEAESVLNRIRPVLGPNDVSGLDDVYKDLNAIVEKNRRQTPSAVSTPPVAPATVPPRPSYMSRMSSMFSRKKVGGTRRKKRKRKSRR